MPAAAIATAAAKANSNIVCLGALTTKSRDIRGEALRTRQALSSDVELWLGGTGFSTIGPTENVRCFQNLDDYVDAVIQKIKTTASVNHRGVR